MADWSRHEALAGFGAGSQRRLQEARVLVVGLGGLGSPVARYLAAAGIGHLSLCDFDTVSASDLHRQILYGPGDVGQGKAATAGPRIQSTHPDCAVTLLERPFEADDVVGHDVVVDCTDEPGTRALVHHACLAAGVPLVWGTVEGWDGQVATVVPGGPCLDCLFPEGREARACSEVGVFGPGAGLVGTAMATEACHVARGAPALAQRLLIIDAQEMRFDEVARSRRASCLCAEATK